VFLEVPSCHQALLKNNCKSSCLSMYVCICVCPCRFVYGMFSMYVCHVFVCVGFVSVFVHVCPCMFVYSLFVHVMYVCV